MNTPKIRINGMVGKVEGLKFIDLYADPENPKQINLFIDKEAAMIFTMLVSVLPGNTYDEVKRLWLLYIDDMFNEDAVKALALGKSLLANANLSHINDDDDFDTASDARMKNE